MSTAMVVFFAFVGVLVLGGLAFLALRLGSIGKKAAAPRKVSGVESEVQDASEATAKLTLLQKQREQDLTNVTSNLHL